jgi:hypothetical protein
MPDRSIQWASSQNIAIFNGNTLSQKSISYCDNFLMFDIGDIRSILPGTISEGVLIPFIFGGTCDKVLVLFHLAKFLG